MFDHLTFVEICRFVEVCDDTQEWSWKAQSEVGLCDEKGVPVSSEVRAGVMAIDVKAGQHAVVRRKLTRFTMMASHRIWLACGVYDLTGGGPLNLQAKGRSWWARRAARRSRSGGTWRRSSRCRCTARTSRSRTSR